MIGKVDASEEMKKVLVCPVSHYHRLNRKKSLPQCIIPWITSIRVRWVLLGTRLTEFLPDLVMSSLISMGNNLYILGILFQIIIVMMIC